MLLESATAAATVSLSRGGRLGSLVIGGNEILLTAGIDPDFGWGSFPMVPYAGRVGFGRFTFEGASFDLPISMPPHAIHGTAWRRPWSRVDDGTNAQRASITADLGPDWPLGGSVRQDFSIFDDRLEMSIIVTAGSRAMPAMVGWHPWFRRVLLSGIEARLDVDAAAMWDHDDDGLPTGELVPVPEGPWDHCFTDLAADPIVTWPGALELTLSSSCRDWVIYTQPEHAFCVEPQTGAPDEFNREPHVLTAGESLRADFTMAWRLLEAERS